VAGAGGPRERFSVASRPPVRWAGCGTVYFQCDGFGELIGETVGILLQGVAVCGFPGPLPVRTRKMDLGHGAPPAVKYGTVWSPARDLFSHQMMLVVHIIVLFVSLCLFYLTLVMKESTEGKWINQIEELWIRVDDRNKSASETTKALAGLVGTKVARTFNRLVGERSLSLRMVGLSGSLSFACLFLILGLALELIAALLLLYSGLILRLDPAAAKAVQAFPLVIALGLVFLLLFGIWAILATLPLILKSSIWVWLSCLPTALVACLYIRLLLIGSPQATQFGIPSDFALSIVSDLLLLIALRKSLKWMLGSTTIFRIVATISFQFALLLGVFTVPFFLLILGGPEHAKTQWAGNMFILGVFNLPTAFASASFILLLAFVLLHRVLWPLLSQWVYVLTRSEVFNKRKSVRAVAFSMLLYGLSGLHIAPAMIKLVERLLR
jgi:hypothetical protein